MVNRRPGNIWFQLRLTWRLIQDARVNPWTKLIPFAGLLYVLSPLDLIPEFLLLVGLIDDVGLSLLAVRLFHMSVPRHIMEQHLAQMRGETMRIDAQDYEVTVLDEGTEGDAGEEPPSSQQADDRRPR